MSSAVARVSCSSVRSATMPIAIIKNKKITENLYKEHEPKVFYGLTQGFLGPSSFSPPNNFIVKLKQRMDVYEETMNCNLGTTPLAGTSFKH